MTYTTEDVARIAAGLTKAQQRSVVNAHWSERDGVWHPEGWYTGKADKRVRRALCGLKLIRDYLRRSYPLTPLGLAVRQHLQEQAND